MSTSVPGSAQKQTRSGSSSSVAARCAVCGKADKLLRCSRCKSANYCTKEHQKLDWKRHKKLCQGRLPVACTPPKMSSSIDPQQQAQTSSKQLKKKSPIKSPVKSSEDKVDNKLQNNENQSAKSYSSDIKDSLHTKEPRDDWTSAITYEGSSEDTILGARSELLNPLQGSKILNRSDNKPTVEISGQLHNNVKNFPEVCLKKQEDKINPSFLPLYKKNIEEINAVCRNVIKDMNKWGVCVIDNFIGTEKGLAVLDEVLSMYNSGVFKDGQLVKASSIDMKTIRSDKITWIDGTEKNCQNIRALISKVDTIIMRANKMPDNGKLGDYTINGRTKAMVACYPSSGAHYVKHVDNPNQDGRCITAIYYLNRDWDIKQNGGLLRIFPENLEDQVADIEPHFDRMIFFWSDRRNPHEVQPAFKMRYAVTLWYFDSEERKAACQKYQSDRDINPNPENS